jgi:hypothetical protein
MWSQHVSFQSQRIFFLGSMETELCWNPRTRIEFLFLTSDRSRRNWPPWPAPAESLAAWAHIRYICRIYKVRKPVRSEGLSFKLEFSLHHIAISIWEGQWFWVYPYVDCERGICDLTKTQPFPRVHSGTMFLLSQISDLQTPDLPQTLKWHVSVHQDDYEGDRAKNPTVISRYTLPCPTLPTVTSPKVWPPVVTPALNDPGGVVVKAKSLYNETGPVMQTISRALWAQVVKEMKERTHMPRSKAGR